MQNYNNIQKLYHNFFFKFPSLNKAFYEIEKILYLKKTNPKKNNKHVFISGLPRAGTTILLNIIYESNLFASLKYYDVPSVLSPNYNKFFKNNKTISIPRAHNDNIYYNSFSPEAFDEIFFNVFSKDQEQENFDELVDLICFRDSKERYLSKNNNMYKRFTKIMKIFPNSIFLIPIRLPLFHCQSLYNQHINFNNLQKKDPFIRYYMNFLSHFEFGLDHRYWHKPNIFENNFDINYWLEQWFMFYEFLYLRYKSNSNIIFLPYEKLSDKNYQTILGNRLDFNLSQHCNKFKISTKKIISDRFDPELLQMANDLYETITEK